MTHTITNATKPTNKNNLFLLSVSASFCFSKLFISFSSFEILALSNFFSAFISSLKFVLFLTSYHLKLVLSFSNLISSSCFLQVSISCFLDSISFFYIVNDFKRIFKIINRIFHIFYLSFFIKL